MGIRKGETGFNPKNKSFEIRQSYPELGKTTSNSYEIKMSNNADNILMYIGTQSITPPPSVTGNMISCYPK